MIKAVGFDLGETLIFNPGIPMSWQSLYRDALMEVAKACGHAPDDDSITAGESILAKYNTRLNPRTVEVGCDVILGEVLSAWSISEGDSLDLASDAFFQFFMQNSKPYDDTVATLEGLRKSGLRIGILTDVPYGMAAKYVQRDIRKFQHLIDVVLASTDVGYRKPETAGYLELAARLGVSPSEMIYVGNESKDIEGAKLAGMQAVLVNRTASTLDYGQDITITSLRELIK